MPDRLTKKDIKKTKKPVRSLQEQELYKKPIRSLQEQDPYLARPELQEGFYEQVSKPITSYETLMGTEAKTAPNITDTESFKKGGKIKPKKAFLGLAVKALPTSLIGIGADKLLKNSSTARSVASNLGIGGNQLSKYYEDQNTQPDQNTKKLKTGGGATKPGLWANINRRKRLGISRPKSESTISKEAYSNMKKGFPKKAKGGSVMASGSRLGRTRPTKLY